MDTTIRKAVPSDVVNLYRLVSTQDDLFAFGRPDEARALAFVLDLITRGYVVVAEHSGRLVGTIGFALYPPSISKDPVMDCEWFCVVPSYRDADVGSQLLDPVMKTADNYKAQVRLRASESSGVIDLDDVTRWREVNVFLRSAVKEEKQDAGPVRESNGSGAAGQKPRRKRAAVPAGDPP